MTVAAAFLGAVSISGSLERHSDENFFTTRRRLLGTGDLGG